MDYSLIIPCHNLEKEIKNLLLSLHMLNLQNLDCEIIFILDNCTDNTKDIIRQYMYDMKYKTITAFAGAPGLARNLGLNLCSGTYVWFIDGDDWLIYPDILQQVDAFFQTHPDEYIVQIKFISNLFQMQHYSMVWQYIFKYDLLKNIRFNNKQNKEDNDFMSEVLNYYFTLTGNTKLSYLPIPSYFYNYNRPGSQTTILRENLTSKI